MRTNGLFTIHSVTIPFQKFGEPIYIIPFGDIHRSSSMCHVEKWRSHLAWAKTKKNAYFIGMGDYDDLASTSERMILLDRKLHESTANSLEDMYRHHTEKLAKELEFARGRYIGLIEGNHYGEFSDGTTTTQLLSGLLATKYLGCSAFIRVYLVQMPLNGKKSGKSVHVDIWAHHGMGAARLVGGSLNRVQQMEEAASADIYLMGHDHKKSVGTKTRLKLKHTSNSLRLSHQKVLIARTGSFLRGYVPGQSSYVADGAMSPTDLGVVKIELTPRRVGEYAGHKRTSDLIEVDIHASI
jgi:hypothetical protein